jgi:hypothetical protein
MANAQREIFVVCGQGGSGAVIAGVRSSANREERAENRNFGPWEDAPGSFQAPLAFGFVGPWEDQTDTMPLRCDHLVNNRQCLSFGGACTLALVSILAIIPTVVDLDQMGDEAALVASLSPRRPPESGKDHWVCNKIQEGVPRLLYFFSRTW